jgi:hypothetical protein
MLLNAVYFIWQTSEVKTWLADESVLAHFESVEIETVSLMQRVNIN